MSKFHIGQQVKHPKYPDKNLIVLGISSITNDGKEFVYACTASDDLQGVFEESELEENQLREY